MCETATNSETITIEGVEGGQIVLKVDRAIRLIRRWFFTIRKLWEPPEAWDMNGFVVDAGSLNLNPLFSYLPGW